MDKADRVKFDALLELSEELQDHLINLREKINDLSNKYLPSDSKALITLKRELKSSDSLLKRARQSSDQALALLKVQDQSNLNRELTLVDIDAAKAVKGIARIGTGEGLWISFTQQELTQLKKNLKDKAITIRDWQFATIDPNNPNRVMMSDPRSDNKDSPNTPSCEHYIWIGSLEGFPHGCMPDWIKR